MQTQKLKRLISQKTFRRNNYDISVVSFSSYDLDVRTLKYGLHDSFTDKTKYVKRD